MICSSSLEITCLLKLDHQTFCSQPEGSHALFKYSFGSKQSTIPDFALTDRKSPLSDKKGGLG